MRSVYRYPLKLVDDQDVELPDGAQILSVARREGRMDEHAHGVISDAVDMWALVDPSAPPVKRRIHVVGTGRKITFRGRFLGTVQVRGGALVFHVFESTERLPVPAPRPAVEDVA